MRKPYKKILQDCWLKRDDKTQKQVKIYDDSIIHDDLDREYIFVDDSIAGTVKKLNDTETFVTTGSCSGVFEEHYYMDMLEMQLPYSELLQSMNLTVMNIRMPVLAVEPFYHEEYQEEYTVSKKFYEMKEAIGSDTYDVKNQKVFSWKLSTSLSSSGEDQKELIYTFRPRPDTFAQSLRLSESYEEMDKNIRNSISNLEEFLLNEQ